MLKFVLLFSLYFAASNSGFDYGEFKLTIKKFESCNGPKRKNCIDIVLKEMGDVSLDFDINVTASMNNVKGRIVGSMNDKQIISMHVKNLCEHVYFKTLVQSLFNSTNHCCIEKGHYRFRVDAEMITQSFFAGKFMYGNWQMKWNLYNDYCNLHSGKMILLVVPKK